MSLFERMTTRRKRLDYRALNDGSDEEVAPEDRVASSTTTAPLLSRQSAIDVFINIPDDEVLPSESASQLTELKARSTTSETSIHSSNPFLQGRQRPAPVTEWLWAYFETTTVDKEWIVKKTNKRRLTDREIRCAYIDDKTGTQCNWRTMDSLRQNSTSNMKIHLAKHSIYPPDTESRNTGDKQQTSVVSLWEKKETLTHQQLLEKNLIRRIVAEKQAFTTIESATFRQIFHDIPGIALPFSSRHTLRRRLQDDFDIQRLKLNDELARTCRTIALSLDIWTSRNHLPIIGIIGHWITEGFEYRERVLDFKEVYGTHSGENLAAAVETTLVELGLERKLITITADNATKNETLACELFHCLSRAHSNDSVLLYRGLDSYIRCLAHILNLIVKDILHVLKSGNVEEASAACDNLRDGNSIGTQTALARLRILALWIDRTPQRKQKWNEVCKIYNLPDKYIEYDVDTRWNSTFRMLDDSLRARQQISKFLELQTELPAFTTQDWLRLTQIHKVLSKFNELTLFISKRNPQISLAIPIYYELHDFLHDASEFKNDFVGFDADIGLAVKKGIKKYNKYYSLMDESDVYYTALVLDPRVKGNLILDELREDNNSGVLILETIRQNLYQQYPLAVVRPGLPMESGQDSESRIVMSSLECWKGFSPGAILAALSLILTCTSIVLLSVLMTRKIQTGFAIGGVLIKMSTRRWPLRQGITWRSQLLRLQWKGCSVREETCLVFEGTP